MSLQTKVIGRTPTDHGPYNPNKSYGKKFCVTLFGCMWESLHDNNNTAPAVWDGGDTITPNLVDWKKVSGDYNAWLMNQNKPAQSVDYPFNGMGRVKLLKHVVDGHNLLYQDDFYKDGPNNTRVPNTNTVFEVPYEFELAENITIPAGSILDFQGGSISGQYTISGVNTGIKAGLVKILGTDVTLDGSWDVGEAYPEWMEGSDDFSTAFNKLGAIERSIIVLSNKEYPVKQNVALGDFVSVKGGGRSVVHLYDSYISVGYEATLRDFNIYIDTVSNFANFSTAILIDGDRIHPRDVAGQDFVRGTSNIHITIDNICISDRSYTVDLRSLETSAIHAHASATAADSGVWKLLCNNVRITANVKRAFYFEQDSDGWFNDIVCNDCTVVDAAYSWWFQGNSTHNMQQITLNNCSMQWDATKSIAALYCRYTRGVNLHNFRAWDKSSQSIDADNTNLDMTIDFIEQTNPFQNKVYPRACYLGGEQPNRDLDDFIDLIDGNTVFTFTQLLRLPITTYRVKADTESVKCHKWLALPSTDPDGFMSIEGWGVGKQFIYASHVNKHTVAIMSYVPSLPYNPEGGSVDSSYWNFVQTVSYQSKTAITSDLSSKQGTMKMTWDGNYPVWFHDDTWSQADGTTIGVSRSGTYANRPTTGIRVGFQYFNTDSHKMITWDGSKYWNPDGTEATS